jgi:hypothetical protein
MQAPAVRSPSTNSGATHCSRASTLAPLAVRLATSVRSSLRWLGRSDCNPFVPHSLQPPSSRLAQGCFSCVPPATTQPTTNHSLKKSPKQPFSSAFRARLSLPLRIKFSAALGCSFLGIKPRKATHTTQALSLKIEL